MRRRVHLFSAWAALAAALVAASLDAEAQPVPRDRASCVPPRSAVRHERLSKLLHELAVTRSFRVENWSHEDPIVVIAGGGDVELIEALSSQVNLITRYAAARDCPGQWRIETIWVLPGLPQSPVQRPSSAGPPAALAVAPSATDAAIAKRSMDMYMQAHGLGRKTGPTASLDSSPASGPGRGSSPD